MQEIAGDTAVRFAPKDTRKLSPPLLFVTIGAGLVAWLAWRAWTASLGLQDIAAALGLGIAAMGAAAWAVLEEKRLRSVVVSDESVTALAWQKLPGWVPIGLAPVTIRWEQIRRVGTWGLVIWLDDGRHRVPINTLLFSDPRAVRDFIRRKLPEHDAGQGEKV